MKVSRRKPRQARREPVRLSYNEWRSEVGLSILRGLALQCNDNAELARMMNESDRTLKRWMAADAKVGEASRLNRAFADAAVLNYTFELCAKGNAGALANWWRFRLAGVKGKGVRRRTARIEKTIIYPPAACRQGTALHTS